LVFELVVGEALILTGQYEEGLYYLSHASKRTGGAEYSFPELQQTILLFEVISLFKQGRSQAAIEKFVLIKPYEFHFLRKQYMITLYLSLATKIKRRIARFEEQLNSPITELGFLKLKEII
jgi:ATP/maltotriose-dependent transcriptional regulator MalT